MRLAFALALSIPAAAAAFAQSPAKPAEVPQHVMQRVYEEAKTPYKYGIVLKEEGKRLDCPSVFRHGGRWWMVYIVFDGTGYETHLAESGNLLDWTPRGVILPFTETTWDARQKGGYIALQDTEWGGSHKLRPFKERYWMSYLGGALEGYETDPLSIGVAWTDDPTQPKEWTRHPEPVLTGSQPDAREWETLTLYKSNIIWDDAKTLGHPFVMYYNAKPGGGHERIGMALSDDMTHWKRLGTDPVVDNGSGISGDPQVVRMDDVWVMFYFGAFWKPKAFDTFACSYDLVNWTTWDGPHLVEPSEPWDETYAHKPWMVKHDGVVYHFYCAVGSEGRVIALATSKDMRNP